MCQVVVGLLRVVDRVLGMYEHPKVPGFRSLGARGHAGAHRNGVNMLLLADQPLQALETLLLLQIVSKRLQDHAKAASSSCQLTQLLLNLGCPSYAQVSTGLLSPRPQGQ